MPFTIERNDLAYMEVDAIVVPANEGLQINGGAGLRVAQVAGLAEMQAACDEIGGCPTGSAVVTPAFALSADFVVHVVGPVWQGGGFGEELMLRRAYDSALGCARRVGARSIALPLVSAHTFGVSPRLSFALAVEAVKAFLRDYDAEVRIVLYGSDALAVGKVFYGEIAEYIDDHYVDAHALGPNAAAATARYEGERPTQAPPVPTGRPGKKKRGALAALIGAVGDAGAKVHQMLQAPGRDGSDVVRADDEPDRLESPCLASDQLDQLREPAYDRGFCPHCGAEVSDGVIFCMQCGYKLRKPSDIESGSGLSGGFADLPELSVPPSASLASGADTAQFAAIEPCVQGAAIEPCAQDGAAHAPTAGSGDLAAWLDRLDAPFSTTLLALIDARGMTDAEVYKRANMSRQHFSKIRSDASYRPTKKTVLALAVALGLDLGETEDLLRRAGFALSRSSKADVIVEYFIVNGSHDIFAINEALYAFDQPIL